MINRNDNDMQQLQNLSLAERKELIDFQMKASYKFFLKTIVITMVIMAAVTGLILFVIFTII
jgi:hypothetical protein